MLRMGILGTGRIVAHAMIGPALQIDGIDLVGISGRNPEKAQSFAARFGLTNAYPTPEAMLSDEAIDAVYIALPNVEHARWAVAAIHSGKHVLCEKPFAMNAIEAEQVRAIGQRHDRIVMEAFHYRYHPVFARGLELIRSGRIGRIKDVTAQLVGPCRDPDDIRRDPSLGGGALMDLGCYCLHALRAIAGGKPAVRGAQARWQACGVDEEFSAQMTFPGEIEGKFQVSISPDHQGRCQIDVEGTQGRISLGNFLFPARRHTIEIHTSLGTFHEAIKCKQSTYELQLRAFADAASGGTAPLTGMDDAVANLQAIDACRSAAGPEPWRQDV
jgi:predicted dehydrogenase